MTLRGLDVLAAAQVIACEDTRSTRKLLSLYEIPAPHLVACHDHNEQHVANNIVAAVQEGKVVALVSDAGSPLISDPGYRVVSECVQHGISVTALPGATAIVPALSLSALPVHAWTFRGFPPHKKGRKTFIESVVTSEYTSVLYESPHRISKLLQQLCELGAEQRHIVVCREISKKFEEVLRGTCREVCTEVESRGGLKGEIVVVVEGCTCL